MSLETSSLRLGYVPLVDAAPLIVAAERGYFAARGLEVELLPLTAWASVRDRLAAGVLDGAHLLAPMVAASRLGLDGLATPLATALTLSREGNAVVVSKALCEALIEASPGASAETLADPTRAGQALAAVVRARAAKGRARLVFAHVHPHSTHRMLLQQWLAGAGLDAERDLRLCAIAPPQMAAHLEAGAVDGFCVGAPWGSLAAQAGHGRLLMSSAALAPGHPEKVLAVREDWAQANPASHVAMTAALLEAGAWAEDPANTEALIPILLQTLTRSGRLPLPEGVLRDLFAGRPGAGAPRFHPLALTRPDPQDAQQLAKRLLRAAGLPEHSTALATAAAGSLMETWRAAVESRPPG